MDLIPPYPYFGGKRRIAELVWQRFGRLARYTDPFCGSLAVPLLAPHPPPKEIFNDANGLLVNAWRAIQNDPDGVMQHAGRPQSEVEMQAIHAAMRKREPELVSRLKADHTHYNVEVAGWWVWGMCVSIGNHWARTKLPASRPELTSNRGVTSSKYTANLMREVSKRIQGAKITCGDWGRVVTALAITANASPTNVTGIFLDPPYTSTDRSVGVYGEHDTTTLGESIQSFCEQWGDDNRARIALCGYEGDYDLPDWDVVAWKAGGGYGNQSDGQGRKNATRERVWFSPHCLSGHQQLTIDALL